MSENKVLEIKLFGKTIQLGSISNGDMLIAKRFDPSDATADVDFESSSCDHNFLCSKQGENRGDEDSSSPSTITENPKTPSNDSDQTSSTNSQDQNPPKKPDKISPCPRCSSMHTKFCYFNNYNVNQPRHFCKNCQRYWTAGGTMRNVPMGSGKRQNKNSPAFHHRHHLGTNGEPPPVKLPNYPSNGLTRLEMKIPIPTLCLTLGNGNGNGNGNEELNSTGKGVSEGERTSEGFPISSVWHYSWNQIAWKSGFPVLFHPTPPATSTPKSPTLGKHSRDNVEEPIEDKKSSNWERGFFRGLHHTQGADHDHDHDRNNHPRAQESSMILQANPAALCRSVSFHEIAQLG